MIVPVYPTNATVAVCQPRMTVHQCQEIPDWHGISIGLTLFVQLLILLVLLKKFLPNKS
jgi:hypothetical protein